MSEPREKNLSANVMTPHKKQERLVCVQGGSEGPTAVAELLYWENSPFYSSLLAYLKISERLPVCFSSERSDGAVRGRRRSVLPPRAALGSPKSSS